VTVLLISAAGVFSTVLLFPRSDEPFNSGPIVVLGGGNPHRIDGAALILADDGHPRRLLVASAATPEHLAGIGRSCDEPHVWCTWPEPASTYGESRMIATWVAEEGWQEVTVVTSDYHVTRSRWLVERCVDVPVSVVGVDRDLSLLQRVGVAARETAKLVRSLLLHRSC
jgi:hypothetical protein